MRVVSASTVDASPFLPVMERSAPTTIIVLATYERADALEVVLRALSQQSGGHSFEVVIADDGSAPRWQQ